MKQTIMIALTISVMFVQPALAEKDKPKPATGEQIFTQHCASCHTGGGNSVNESKPIVGSKELATIGKFKSYLSNPPGHMPYYQNLVNDRKMLDALHKYCKSIKTVPKKA